MEDTGEAPRPPLTTRGAKGINAPPIPIDPLTGKPVNFLPPGLNVYSGGGGGGGGKKKNDDDKVCVYFVQGNGTVVEDCDTDPVACGVCLLPRRRRKELFNVIDSWRYRVIYICNC